MEKQLQCVLLLSLKEMALRRVANLFWNDPDILSSVPTYDFAQHTHSPPRKHHIDEWLKCTENKIKDKIMKLLLPEWLIKELIALIKPVSIEILEWKDAHQYFLDTSGFNFDIPGRAKLQWTTSGRINYQKTAESLILCNEMDIEARYEIACYNCLEDYIFLYWLELSEDKKMKYGNCKVESPELPYCWPHILQGKHSELDYLWVTSTRNLTSFNQCAFEFYAKSCCITAAKYFLRKLTLEERQVSLMRSAGALVERSPVDSYLPELIPDVLFFLISEMTPEQQMEALDEYPEEIMSCFIRWPWVDLLLVNADFFWSLIDYDFMIDAIHQGYFTSDFNFPKMFKGFIMVSPPDFQKHFVEKENETGHTWAFTFLKEFFIRRDSESIIVLFRALDKASRVNIVFQNRVVEMFYEWGVAEIYDLVLLCLREATMSNYEKERMKEALTRCIEHHLTEKSGKSKFETIFNFLDENSAISDDAKISQKRKLGICSMQ